MKKYPVLFILLAAIPSLAVTPLSPKECVALLLRETEVATQLVRQLKDGPLPSTQTSPIPQDRTVTLRAGIFLEEQTYSGELLGWAGESRQEAVLLLAGQRIGVTTINPNSVVVSRPSRGTDLNALELALFRAMHEELAVEFAYSPTSYLVGDPIGARVAAGLIVAVQENSFTLLLDNGERQEYALDSADRESFLVSPVHPKTLSAADSAFFQALATTTDHVSFEAAVRGQAKPSFEKTRWEGWIQRVFLNASGEPLVQLMRDWDYRFKPENLSLMQRGVVIPLSRIYAETFTRTAQADPVQISPGASLHAPTITAFLVEKGRKREIPVSAKLRAILSAFGDSHRPMDNTVPPELTEGMPPRSQLRFVFTLGRKKEKLTFRRNGRGATVIAEEYGPFNVENLRNRLTHVQSALAWPAINLGIKGQIKAWRQALPADYFFQTDLFLHAHGYRFTLEKGLEPIAAATDPHFLQLKAAVEYLIEKGLAFSVVEHQGVLTDAANPPSCAEGPWSYPFETELIRTLELSGAVYSEGVWRGPQAH